MQLIGPENQDFCDEIDVLNRLLDFRNARVLELGCGGAEKTRQLAETTELGEIVAAEVDTIAHAKNLEVTDLAKVTFKPYGAENIDEPDGSFDIVLMFKSLHHVPLDALDTALTEIRRVLKPGGYLYVSEPVFDGAFNDVIRLFHDEQTVRQAAFDAMQRAVDQGIMQLKEEYFFKNTLRLKHFGQFEQGILNVTHTEHDLSAELLAEVKSRFESNKQADGYNFEIPNRIDLLQKVNSG